MTKLPNDFYPNYNGLEPFHAVTNWAYVRRLIRAAKKGEQINPILVQGEKRNGWLLTGTHRAAANLIMQELNYPNEILIPTINIDDLEHEFLEEIKEAAEEGDIEKLDLILDRSMD